MLCRVCNEKCNASSNIYNTCNICWRYVIVNLKDFSNIYPVNIKIVETFNAPILFTQGDIDYYNHDELETCYIKYINNNLVEYKKDIIDTITTKHRHRHIFNYIYRNYYCSSLCIGYYGNNIKRISEYNKLITFNDLQHGFCDEIRKISTEYIYSLETMEDVKIRLENSFNKFNKISTNRSHVIRSIHKLIDIEFDTLEKIAAFFDIDVKSININGENIQRLLVCDDLHFNKWLVTAYTHTLIKNIMKNLKVVYNFAVKSDSNLQTINDLRKTNILDIIKKNMKKSITYK